MNVGILKFWDGDFGFSLYNSGPTFIAELSSRWQFGSALMAQVLQFRATFKAELGSFSILILALRTLRNIISPFLRNDVRCCLEMTLSIFSSFSF